jgi:hypothetical protein
MALHFDLHSIPLDLYSSHGPPSLPPALLFIREKGGSKKGFSASCLLLLLLLLLVMVVVHESKNAFRLLRGFQCEILNCL